MGRVLIADRELGVAIGIVDQRLEAGLTRTRRVGQELLERVVRLQRQTMTKPPANLHLQCVVARFRSVGQKVRYARIRVVEQNAVADAESPEINERQLPRVAGNDWVGSV